MPGVVEAQGIWSRTNPRMAGEDKPTYQARRAIAIGQPPSEGMRRVVMNHEKGRGKGRGKTRRGRGKGFGQPRA